MKLAAAAASDKSMKATTTAASRRLIFCLVYFKCLFIWVSKFSASAMFLDSCAHFWLRMVIGTLGIKVRGIFNQLKSMGIVARTMVP